MKFFLNVSEKVAKYLFPTFVIVELISLANIVSKAGKFEGLHLFGFVLLLLSSLKGSIDLVEEVEDRRRLKVKWNNLRDKKK